MRAHTRSVADTTYLDPTGFRVAMKQVRNDPAVDDHRHLGHGHGVPQAFDCLRRREVGDLEVDRRRDHHRAGLCRGLRRRHGCRRGDRRAATTATGMPSPRGTARTTAPCSAADRSMGSIIKLLTPSAEFSEEHNSFIRAIPPHVLELVYVIKKAYRRRVGRRLAQPLLGQPRQRPPRQPAAPGRQQVLVDMLRVGFESDGSYRLFSACGQTSRRRSRCRPRTTSPPRP
jgi:hypothetical protein